MATDYSKADSDTEAFGVGTPMVTKLRRYDMGEMIARKRAATMLSLGALSGFFGFAFAFAIGLIKAYPAFNLREDGYCYREYDMQRLVPCYFPATVSEMVCEDQSPSGRIFFFFEFTGAILIFLSWYPTSLRNVYIGDDARLPLTQVSWLSFRQYVPAPGMMMLATITTVPIAQADILDYFCIALHLFGAMMMFVGYFFAEGVSIGWGPFRNCISDEKKHMSSKELYYRRWVLTGVVVSYLVFCVLQVILSVGSGDGFDHWEVLQNCTDTFLSKTDCMKPQLVKAADRPVKKLKKLSYGSEVVCGLFVIASHFLIWYYCEERHYDLPEELAQITSHTKYEIEDEDSE